MKNQYQNASDAELANLFNTGDRIALEEIYNRYWLKLLQFARRMMADDELAKDSVQDVFLMLVERKGSFELRETVSNFLYSSMRNKILNLIKRDKVKVEYMNFKQVYQETVLQPDALLIEKEFAAIIDREIEQLPPRMRAVYDMSRKKYMTYKQIAEENQVSVETVRRQISSSLSILKGKLGSFIFLQLMGLVLLLNRI